MPCSELRGEMGNGIPPELCLSSRVYICTEECQHFLIFTKAPQTAALSRVTPSFLSSATGWMVISLTLEEVPLLGSTGEKEEDCDINFRLHVTYKWRCPPGMCIYESQGGWKCQCWIQRSMAHVQERSE